MKSLVTIGLIARERFSLAAESLKRIFDYTDIPFELIVVIFRRSVFNNIEIFDKELSIREFVDMSLALRSAGCSIVIEPSCEVVFFHPAKIQTEEKNFFLMCWDYEKSIKSHDLIQKKWNLLDLLSAKEFVQSRRATVKFHEANKIIFWWLDYYQEFQQYLRSQFRQVLANERLFLFDLRSQRGL